MSLEAIIIKVALAICMVESGNDPNGFNASENAVGIAQIRPIMIDEANRLIGSKRYKNSDRTNPMISKQIIYTVLSKRVEAYERHHDFQSEAELIRFMCQIWNRGEKYHDDVVKAMEIYKNEA